MVLVINAEAKWLVEHGPKVANTPQPSREALRPHILYSDDTAGSCKWGGWHKPGRVHFQSLRGKIKKGRSLPTTKTAEEQSRVRLYEQHDMENKLASKKRKPKLTVPKIDLTGAAVGFESDGDYEFDEPPADEVQNLLAQAAGPPAAHAAQQAGDI